MKNIYTKISKLLLLSVFLIGFGQVGMGQTQIYVLNFESSGGYTTSMSEQTDNSSDYFIRTDGSNIAGTYNSPQGSYFFAAQDINADGMSSPATLTIDDVNISGYSSLELRVYLAEDDDGANQDWDDDDYLHIDYDIDNTGTFTNGIWVENDGSTYNSAPYIDTDYDGDGDGTEITNTFAQFTKSISGTGSLIDIQVTFEGLTSSEEDIAIDHIEIWGTAASSNDNDSQVSASTALTEPATIASTVTAANGLQVFDFTFSDAGTVDGLATIIDQLQITQGDNNAVADWTNAIAGAVLNGPDQTNMVGTVNAGNITFSNAGMISIADGGNETYTLSIWLKTDLSAISDNDVLEFAMDYSNISTNASGSSFGSGAPESGDTKVAVDITAVKLLFVQEPTDTEVNAAMSPDPTVKACDANGNIDTDYSTAISVSSDGTMTGNPVAGSWSSGVATFANLTHTVVEATRTLTATSGTLTDGTSANFDITAVSTTCGSETFTNSNATSSYSNGNYVGDNGVTWNYVASRDDAGYQITGAGLMLRRSSSNSKVYSGSVSGGISNFTCKLLKGYTGSGNRQVELFVNGVSQGTSIAWDNTSVQTFTVNNIDISGNVVVEIRNITSKQVVVDDISWECYGSSNDADSEANAPTGGQQVGGFFSSLDDTPGEAVDVFKFDIEDKGTADGLPTHVTNIRIVPASSNTADWTDHIQGLTLNNGSAITIGAPTITDTYIDIPITSGNLDVADGGVETITMAIYLNTSNIVDGDVLSFMVDADAHGFTADVTGSTFTDPFPADVVSNDFTITVVATELRYATNASDANVNTCMSPDVQVEATDENGNRDTGFTSDISITSTGSLSTSPIVVTASSGVATFSGADCIEHTMAGTNYHLTAERDGSADWDVNSADFDITDINACGLEEFNGGTTAPAGWTFTNIGGTYTTSGNFGNSSPSLKMDNTGDIIETATVTSPSQLSFWIKGQGTDASSALLVEGWDGSWNTIENIIPLPTTGTTKTYSSGLSSYTKFRFSYTRSAGNLSFDDVDVTCGSCVLPTNDATNITFPTINSTSLDLLWSSGNGGNRIVVCRKEAAVSFTPTDNTTYTANSDYSAGTEVGTVGEGNKVIYNGSASTTTVNGLLPGTTYYFKIYEYGCSSGSEMYYTTGTPAEANETTLPENVSDFTLTCITNTTATLTWNLPSGDFDGIMIAVRESTNAPSNPSCAGATLSAPDTDFSTALVYCGNGTSSKYVYNATGTTVSITGLTSGADYVFKAYTYKGSVWSGGTQTADIAEISDVTSEKTTPSNAALNVSWTNPTNCYDDILVIAHKGGSITGGAGPANGNDGSGYTADATDPFSGTDLGTNDFVVYKGTVNNFDATTLTNGTQYCFKIFVRKGTEWSAGVEICGIPADITVFKPGELVVVGFDSKVSGGSNDGIYLMNFVDIKEGTTFKWVNSRFEAGAAANQRTMHWGGGGDKPYRDPSFLELQWQVNGQGVIPAGSIISFETAGNNLTNTQIDGVANTDLILLSKQGSANVSGSEGDQMWVVQGDFTPYGTDDVDKYNLLDGKVLYGLTSIKPWVPISNAVRDDDNTSGTNTGRESRVHPDLECFNIDLSLNSWDYIYYRNGTGAPSSPPESPLHNGSKRQILLSIQNTTSPGPAGNWSGGIGTINIDISEDFIASTTVPSNSLTIGKRFSFAAGNSDGTWVGGATGYVNDWFTCKNWEGLTVPDSLTDVTIPNVTDAPTIDHTSDKAPKYNYYAECNNIDIDNETLTMEGSDQDTIFIHGNLTMQNSAVLDLDDGNTGTQDGIVYLYGNYDNQVSGDALKQGNSTFNFVGENEQTINADAAEYFYKLNINNTSLAGVKMLDNLSVSNIFNHTDGTLDLNGHNFAMSNEYNRVSGYFEGDPASNFTISGTGNLDDIYFIDDFNVNEFVMSRNGENANLMTNLTTAGKMAISNGGGVTLNAGKDYTVGGVLSNTTSGATGLILKSDASGTASLIQSSGSVRATAERYLTSGWHYYFSPLDDSNIDQMTTTPIGEDNPNFYYYDETVADFWQGLTVYNPSGWTKPAHTGKFSTTMGYVHWYTSNNLYTFIGGNITAVDKDFTLSYTDSGSGNETNTGTAWDNFEGWNLLGNPFTSAIDWDGGITTTDIENFVYYWDDASSQYKYYGTGTPWNNGGVSVNGGTQYIPANQAFFVKANSDANGNTFTIPASVRVHNSQSFWKKGKDEQTDMIKLNIEKGNYTDETVVRTLPQESGVTEGHDGQYDAYKMFSWVATSPQIYTLNTENSYNYAVNSLPQFVGHKVVPVGVYTGETGEYSINMTENNFENTHIWLEDAVLNTNTNLLINNSYTFNQVAELNTDRFFLHFGINHAPELVQTIPDQVIPVNENYEYYLPENMFTDIDFEDYVTVSVSLANGNNLPAWLVYNSEENRLEGMPGETQILEIKIIGTDIFGATKSDKFTLTVKGATGCKLIDENSISIYPNPTKGEFTISLGNYKTANISITNISGQVLKQIYSNENMVQVNLDTLASGIYFIDIKIAGQTIRKKIILQ